MLNLLPHQKDVLKQTADRNKVAYYLDMGLGKTFVGSEKMIQLGKKVNLVICQQTKIDDWIEHLSEYYDAMVLNLTSKKQLQCFIEEASKQVEYEKQLIGVINYELAFRRPQLKKLKSFTLMLDESSMIQNEMAKRSKFILGLQPENIILLSGTPSGGKYEKLWSQLKLLGWKISKDLFWKQYVDVEIIDNEGFPIKIVKGYKNVERLKSKMRQYGCVFLKTDDVFDLPRQTFTTISIPATKEYRKFKKSCLIEIDTRNLCEFHDDSDFYGKDVTPHIELVGDTTLKKMLYERQLCGQYNKNKLNAFNDLLESTNDRLIVFYNFTSELESLINIVDSFNRPWSEVSGKEKDLDAYKYADDSVTFIQYQAGAMGLNLQKANKIVYFTPPLSSELFEQSKKRIHRIGQDKPCFYYQLICKNSVEEKIYETLEMRKDYTEALFEAKK